MHNAQMASGLAAKQQQRVPHPREDIPAYNDRVQDVADALLNRFGPAHVDIVLAALCNEVRMHAALNHAVHYVRSTAENRCTRAHLSLMSCYVVSLPTLGMLPAPHSDAPH